MRAKKRPPNCRTCGLCCVALQDQDVFCDLTGKDVARLPDGFARRNVVDTSFDVILDLLVGVRHHPWCALRTRQHLVARGPLKGTVVCQCVALRGSVMAQVSCSIYRIRPAVCRTVMLPGERACLQLRRMYESAVVQEARDR